MPEGMPAETRFVIVSAPRSGSNLLCTLLNSHPEILCHHEVFNPNGIFYALGCRDGSLDLGTIAERESDPLRFLGALWDRNLGHRCVGFKMTRGQNELVLRSVVDDRAIRKIVLKRRNRVKTYVSTLVAERLDQWEVYKPGELAEPRPRVALGVDGLLANVALNAEFYASIDHALKATNQVALEIAYEDLARRSAHQGLLAGLGVSRREFPLVPGSIKQNSADLRQVVDNFDEVLTLLGGSELAAELCSLAD
jgi:LPS sulfotransferase NodH